MEVPTPIFILMVLGLIVGVICFFGLISSYSEIDDWKAKFSKVEKECSDLAKYNAQLDKYNAQLELRMSSRDSFEMKQNEELVKLKNLIHEIVEKIMFAANFLDKEAKIEVH